MPKNDTIYKEMLENMYEGVYFVDAHRKITFWNKGAERISGFEASEVIGSHCFDNILNHVDDGGNQLCLNGCPLHKTIQDGEMREAGVYLHHKEGHRVAVSVRTVPIVEDGDIVGAVEVFVDDSRQVELYRTLDELKLLALYDQLTELPNRHYLDNLLTNRMNEFKQLGIPFGLMMIDIDHFRNFNNQYGHDVGDQVLQMVAKTFQSAFRSNDTIGRWGGEEFLAIVTGVDQNKLTMIAEKVRMLVASSRLRNDDRLLSVRVSIGCTLVAPNESVDTIIKRADVALYASKENGRDQVTVK